MRLWSIHPKYLDAKGLVALWREGLLAQHVLLGKTKGYKHHPQLQRFQAQKDPIISISNYLHFVCHEAEERQYRFDRNKTHHPFQQKLPLINVTKGQLDYERHHFLRKIETRDPIRFHELKNLPFMDPHPCFCCVAGDRESWEIISPTNTL